LKILICSVNFAPERTGIGKYSGEMAAWLVEQGHDVRVIAAPPYYPMWDVDPAYRSPRFRRETWRGVDVWRAPLWVPKNPGGTARVLHLLSFALTAFPLMLRQIAWHPDLVMTVAPALVCAPTALLTAYLAGAQSWLHLQDFEVDVAFQLGLLKGKFLRRIVLRIEQWIMRRFDTVSTISSRMVELLVNKGVSVERVSYLPNWVEISKFKPGSTGSSYRAELGIPTDAIVVLFSGTLGGKQGLMVIPAAAELLSSRKDVVFVICGDGVMKPQIEAATANMPNVRLLPLQPAERLGELLAMADIHVLPQSPGAADLVLPSKLSGMLASGRAVIATCRPGTEIEAVVAGCGVIVPPKDGAALADAITELADDPVTRLAMGRRARGVAEANFEREAVLRRVFGPLESNVSEPVRDAIA
jgi:colanic acid biosynthesis glycosyl transferase WcaI